MIKVKNIDTVQGTYMGEILEANDEFTVPETDRIAWASDDDVINGISTDKLQVGNDTEYFTGYDLQLQKLKGDSPAHTDGSPIITLNPFPNKTKHNLRGKGITDTVPAGTTHDILYKLTEDREFNRCKVILKDHAFNDKADLQFVDVDGVHYPPGTVLATFFYDYHFAWDTQDQGMIAVEYTGGLLKDLYLRIRYYSTGIMDVQFKSNLFLHKKS